METQHDIYDIMKTYKFDELINKSVIIDDDENEPDQSEVLDYGKNDLKGLKENYQYLNDAMQQYHSNIRNVPNNSSKVSSLHRFGDNVTKKNLDCCQRYIPSNNIIFTNAYIKNSHLHTKLENPYNNPEARTPVACNSQKTECVMISRIVRILAAIIKAYVHYSKIISESRNQHYISQINAEYLSIKHKLFHTCMAISKDFLLQFENNYRFTEKLLNKAQYISKITLPKKYIAHLYGDLINWIRFKTCETTKSYLNKTRNDKLSAQTAHQASNFVSKPITNASPPTNIFSSGPPGSQVTISVDPNIIERQKTNQSLLNTITSDLSHVPKNNTNTNSHYVNYSFMGNSNYQNQHSTLSNASTWSSSMYYNGDQLAQYAQNNNCNTIFTEINQINPQNITRSSISRDSGFTSPILSISPSKYYINNIEYSSKQYEHQTSSFGTLNTTTIESDVANDGPHL